MHLPLHGNNQGSFAGCVVVRDLSGRCGCVSICTDAAEEKQ